MLWYGANTVRHIGRVEHAERPEAEALAQQVEPSVPQKYVDELVVRLERSCDRADRRNKNLSKLAESIRKKLKTFKAAIGTTFENFSMEDCNSSQSDEDVEKTSSVPSHTVPPHTIPDTHTALSLIGPSHTRVKKAALKSPRAKRFKKAGPVRPDHSPSKERKVGVPPTKEVLSTPPIARILFDTPVTVTSGSAVVAAAPMATIVSLIWRIKRLPRMRKVPIKFSDYSHSMVHSGYVLNDQEQFFLRGFKEYYESKEDELASICTMISSNDLKKALDEGTWLDTNLMYYYFEIMREGCPTAFIADPSICSWWQDGSDASVEAAFGKHGHRVWEAREAHTLVFVVHYRNHFTLVVGYVDEKRWEFYNSLAGDRLTQNKT